MAPAASVAVGVPRKAKFGKVDLEFNMAGHHTGSSTLYCFRAGPGENDPLANEFQCSFVPCASASTAVPRTN